MSIDKTKWRRKSKAGNDSPEIARAAADAKANPVDSAPEVKLAGKKLNGAFWKGLLAQMNAANPEYLRGGW
jgi:hypothetical protein